MATVHDPVIDPSPAREGQPPANRIAGSTLPLRDGDRGPAMWLRELRTLRACGFDAVDLVDAWVAPARLDGDGLMALGDVLGAAGLELAGISVVRRSVIDPEHGEANLEHTLRTVAAARVLGAPVVSVGLHRPLTPLQREHPFWMVPPPSDARDDATWALAAERIRRVADAAAADGVAVSLELHEGTLIDSAAGALRLLREIGRPNAGINLDLGNLIRVPGPVSEPWRETVERAVGHVNYWHVKNYARLEHPASGTVVSSPVPLGEGEIDYGWALQRIVAGGYTGPLCVEHYGGDALWAMRAGRGYLQHVLEREGGIA